MTAEPVYNICFTDVSPLWVLSLTTLSTSDLIAPKMNLCVFMMLVGDNAISNILCLHC